MVPDRIAYNSLISTYERGKQPEQALGVFQSMRQQGVIPEVITQTALISTCELGKQPEQAVEMLHAMRQQGMMMQNVFS